MNTLQIIESIPKLEEHGFVEWERSFDDILQIFWPFLSNVMYGLEKPVPSYIGGGRVGVKSSSEGDGNETDSSEGIGNDTKLIGLIY